MSIHNYTEYPYSVSFLFVGGDWQTRAMFASYTEAIDYARYIVNSGSGIAVIKDHSFSDIITKGVLVNDTLLESNDLPSWLDDETDYSEDSNVK